jgi:hypothetical protein
MGGNPMGDGERMLFGTMALLFAVKLLEKAWEWTWASTRHRNIVIAGLVLILIPVLFIGVKKMMKILSSITMPFSRILEFQSKNNLQF